jgi:hypothetical protein
MTSLRPARKTLKCVVAQPKCLNNLSILVGLINRRNPCSSTTRQLRLRLMPQRGREEVANNPFRDATGEVEITLAQMLAVLLRYKPIASKPEYHETIKLLCRHIDANPVDDSQLQALRTLCNLMVYGDANPNCGQFEFEIEHCVKITMRWAGTSAKPRQDKVVFIWNFRDILASANWITADKQPRKKLARLITGCKTAEEWNASLSTAVE